jgi:hypothetical protein
MLKKANEKTVRIMNFKPVLGWLLLSKDQRGSIQGVWGETALFQTGQRAELPGRAFPNGGFVESEAAG